MQQNVFSKFKTFKYYALNISVLLDRERKQTAYNVFYLVHNEKNIFFVFKKKSQILIPTYIQFVPEILGQTIRGGMGHQKDS